MKTRIERDRHFGCEPGTCTAPAPRKLAAGRNQGRCVPRRTWWLRAVNSAGRRVSIGFKSEQEAREAARKVEAAWILGQDYTPRTATSTVPLFRDVGEAALKLHASLNALSPATIKNHDSYLKQHLVPAFGSKPMMPKVFNRLAIREFIAAQRGVMMDSTLRASLPTLGIILDHAVERGLLATNPLRGAERLWRPKESNEVEPFTPEQISTVLASAEAVDKDFAVLVQVMAQTGVRPGEGLGLRRCDLDLNRAEIHVEGSWSHNRLGPTKTRKTRVVSLLFPVSEVRAVWRPADAGAVTRRVLDGFRGLTVLPADPEGRLWNMSSTKFDRLWKRVLKKAGLAFRKPHTLRHSFASILLSRGANLLAIQKAGGWRSAQVLLKVYSKWIEEAGSDASIPTSRPLGAQLQTRVGLQAEGLRGREVSPGRSGVNYGIERSSERARAASNTASGMARKVTTTAGSKWVPTASRIRSRAASIEIAVE
jgi:integrase